MKQQMQAAAPYVNVFSWESLFMALDERFKFGLTRTELALLAPLCAVGLHLAIKYGRPIAAALYKKLLAAVGAAAILLSANAVEASPARVVLSCAEEVEKLNGETNEIETECKDPEVYLDAGIKFDGLILRLNRPRELLVGFSAGLGYGLRYSPQWWSYTASFVSLDLFAGGGYEANEDEPDAVSVHGLLVLTLFNWIGIGGGIRHAFGLASLPDTTDFLGTFGVSTSF